jgi:hypothetical protein
MQALIAWLGSNWAVVALAVKSLLDLVFVLNPKLDAPGGVIDYIYQAIKKALAPPAPPANPPSA